MAIQLGSNHSSIGLFVVHYLNVLYPNIRKYLSIGLFEVRYWNSSLVSNAIPILDQYWKYSKGDLKIEPFDDFNFPTIWIPDSSVIQIPTELVRFVFKFKFFCLEHIHHLQCIKFVKLKQFWLSNSPVRCRILSLLIFLCFALNRDSFVFLGFGSELFVFLALDVQVVEIEHVDNVLLLEDELDNFSGNDGRNSTSFFALLEENQCWKLAR